MKTGSLFSGERERKSPIVRAASLLAEAGVENARLEAQLLLGLTLGVARASVVAETYGPLTEAQWRRFSDLVEARCRRVPLAYLRGTQEFYGLTFAVSPAVLIPRPETELLVDFVREKLLVSDSRKRLKTGNNIEDSDVPVFADIGTGSGCISIASLAHCPGARAVACELSRDALALARCNALAHEAGDRMRLVQGDLLTGLADHRFDVIVSNPPYIPSGEVEGLQREVREYEPRLALDGGEDGLALVRRLSAHARGCLRPGGWVGFEIALGQAEATAAIFRSAGFRQVAARADLAGIDRIVVGQRLD